MTLAPSICRTVLLPLCLVAGGCSTLSLGKSQLREQLGEPAEVASAPDAETCLVRIYAGRGGPETMRLDVTEPKFVQDALQETGAIHRFRSMDLIILRPRPDGQSPAKIDVAFDRRKRRVPHASDYALYPGDHLLIRRDTKTAFDEFVEQTLEPVLGPLFTR